MSPEMRSHTGIAKQLDLWLVGWLVVLESFTHKQSEEETLPCSNKGVILRAAVSGRAVPSRCSATTRAPCPAAARLGPLLDSRPHSLHCDMLPACTRPIGRHRHSFRPRPSAATHPRCTYTQLIE